MKKSLQLSLLSASAFFVLSQPAHALFVNGGFETGDTTGWPITGDHSVISSYTPQFNNTAGWSSLIPWYGQYSLLLGSPAVGNEWDNYQSSSALQVGSITQTDIDNGAHLYFKWRALLEEPTNIYHSDAAQP